MMKVAVILPVYNESDCLKKSFGLVSEFAQKNKLYHFIFVNDGSTDDSLKILTERAKKISNPSINLISYHPRQGKGFAVKQGVTWIDADYICFTDSDLAYSLEHLELLVEKLEKEKFDVVIGCRNLDSSNSTSVSFQRKVVGKIFNIISRILLNLNFTNMQAGLKGFRKEPAKELFKRQLIHGFSFDVELLYLARKHNFSIGEIPARVTKQHLYKLSKVNIIQDSVNMFISLLKILCNDKAGRYE
ncbi:MAG TPA: glycosyltransferase [Allocoleopsis sp.]